MPEFNRKTTYQRNSSFELLRIILIFLIMTEHINIWFSVPYSQSVQEHIVKSGIETICIGSVNTFVLISGWFGIKGDYKKLLSLIFQLFFCTIPFAIIFQILGKINFLSLNGIYNYLLGGNNYWFIIDYIGLFLLAPLLNVIVEKINIGRFLIYFYVLIFSMDLSFKSDVFGTNGGYSILWFIYLYLIARYLRIYGCSLLEKYKWTILFGSLFAEGVLFYFALIGLRYTNPFILLPAISAILIFKNYSFYNRIINYCALSCLSIYMLHMQPCISDTIREFMTNMYYNIGYWKYMLIGIGLMLLVFLIAIFYDMIRRFIWNKLARFI